MAMKIHLIERRVIDDAKSEDGSANENMAMTAPCAHPIVKMIAQHVPPTAPDQIETAIETGINVELERRVRSQMPFEA